jgi:transcriptional regulator with XRE-family HTH domain
VEKSIHSEGHRRLAELLRTIRQEASLTQAEVARRLREPQSFVAKYEGGERRLDLVELRQIAVALDTDVGTLVTRWEGASPNS